MTTYCIVDDEPIAHRIIEGYCEALPHLQKVGNAYNALEASGIVAEQKVDLIFLDLKMPKMRGFEWLKTVSHPPKVIVTTAHKEHALEGYELNILDYLLKPFSFSRFLKAINKVNEKASVSESHKGLENNHFFVKGHKKHHQINTDDILFIEAYGNYVKIFLTEEMIISHEKISTLEAVLPVSDFIRVHKSFIVAANKIKVVEGNRLTIKEHHVPIGQTYRFNVKHLVSNK